MMCLRRLRLMLVFLLLGAIVNVAVAWACAVWSPPVTWGNQVPLDLPQDWPTNLRSLGWPPLNRANCGVGIGITAVDVSGGNISRAGQFLSGSDVLLVSLEARRFGLPFRAMEWQSAGVVAGDRTTEMFDAANAALGWRKGLDFPRLLKPRAPGDMRRIPIVPRWPGFAMNTVFYAGVCWLLLVAPFAVRRRLRLRRGRCANCDYPVGASDVCTECGKPVAVHGSVTAQSSPARGDGM